MILLVPKASVSGAHGCSKRLSGAHGCANYRFEALMGLPKRQRVAVIGAPSVHEWRPWAFRAFRSGAHEPMSGARGCSKHPRGTRMGARGIREWQSWVPQSVHERRSWAFQASDCCSLLRKVFVSGARGAPKCPGVALIGAPSLHEWRSWALQASMSGAHVCSKLPRVAIVGARKLT